MSNRIFFGRVVAKICPEKGSKSAKRNYKTPVAARVHTVLDRYTCYKNDLNQQEENEEEEDDLMGDS